MRVMNSLSLQQKQWRRRVKIIATLGPRSKTSRDISELLKNGVDVVRLNFSHGSHEEHADLVETVRNAAKDLHRHVAVLQDLQGPKIRTRLDGGPMELRRDDELIISPEPRDEKIATTYSDLYKVVNTGSRILLDDGRMEVAVVSLSGRSVCCKVVRAGSLGSHKGVNLPGAPISMPAFTEKDARDLELGLELGVDWIALSFVEQARDIVPLKEILKKHRVRIPVLAKLERPKGLKNLRGILGAFDGVLVARGDLGVELSPEEVPIWQKSIIVESNRMGKPVVVATQMLESMMQSLRPTRAEASDVANAVLDGADALMLSGETAVGAHPAEAVGMMARIVELTESHVQTKTPRARARRTSTRAIAEAACSVADDLHTQAIAVLAGSGATARLVASARPRSRIFALTRHENLAREIALYWGVEPMVLDFAATMERAISQVEARLLNENVVTPRGDIVVVGSTPLAARVRTNFIKVHTVAAANGIRNK